MEMLQIQPLPLAEEGTWGFRDSTLTWSPPGGGAGAVFDPFPCYPHDLAVVQAAAEEVVAYCPPPWMVRLWVADREEVGRSNGYSHAKDRGRYEQVDDRREWVQDPPVGVIVLSGKRVPPHPAVTRYLVAHEYGHHVEYFLLRARGHDSFYGDDVVAEYAKVRGLPDGAVHHGSGGRWHDSATEVFACDFRILVAGVERGYWPHPGVPYPPDELAGWWEQALAEIAGMRSAGTVVPSR